MELVNLIEWNNGDPSKNSSLAGRPTYFLEPSSSGTDWEVGRMAKEGRHGSLMPANCK